MYINFYIIIILLPLVIFVLDKSIPNNSVTKYLIIVFLTVIAGFRVTVGRDYFNYLNFFDQVASFSKYVHLNEIGLIHLIRLLDTMNINFRVIFIAYAFFTNYLIVDIIFKHLDKRKRFLGLLVYLAMPQFFLQSLNIMRQYFAIAVVFYVIVNYRLSLIKKIVLLIMAFLYGHISVIVIFPFILLAKYKLHFLLQIVILITNIIVYLNIYRILPILGFARYLNFQGQARPLLNIITIIFILSVIYGMRTKIVHRFGTNYNQVMNFIFFSLNIYLLLLIGTGGPLQEIINRVAFFFLIPVIVLVPQLPSLLKGKGEKFTGKAFLFISLYSYYLIHLVSNSYDDRLYPYFLGWNL